MDDLLRKHQNEINGDQNELVIIDEADSVILDSNLDIKAQNVVGLTATALDDLEDNSAKEYLIKYLKFHVYDSAIQSENFIEDTAKCTRENFVT